MKYVIRNIGNCHRLTNITGCDLLKATVFYFLLKIDFTCSLEIFRNGSRPTSDGGDLGKTLMRADERKIRKLKTTDTDCFSSGGRGVLPFAVKM